MFISNCEITGQTSKVLKECVMSDKHSLYKEYGGYHTGVDIEGSSVFNLFDGVVVWVGKNTQTYSVIVQTGDTFCMVYSNLTTADVIKGESINKGRKLGDVYKYVHVEKLSNDTSKWPVRVGQRTWYKADVTGMLYGGYTSLVELPQFDELHIGEMSDYFSGEVEDGNINPTTAYFLSNNGGD